MSVATATVPARSTPGGAALAGTGSLIRFILRRDRIRIPAWLAGIALVQISGAASYPGLYPTEADRRNQAAVMDANPAMKAMTGPGHGLDESTYGAMMTNEYLGLMAVFVALMSVLMVVRHTRAEEETGRLELIRSSIVGRHAHLAAALAVVVATNVALGLLIALGLTGLGIESIDLAGSLLFGAAYAAVGLVFVGIAAVTVQLTEHGRAAAGLAGAAIAAAYVLRAIGDVADNGLSWLSPIGWAQASAPYVDNDWWPLGLAVVGAVALIVAGFALNSRRDIGAGLRQPRPGRSTGTAWLGTPEGFAWRLQQANVVWWALAMLLFGLAYGSAVTVIEEYADNEVIQELVRSIGGASLTESWLAMIISVLAVICTVFAVIAALRPRREETSGRAESVLATSLSRTRWVATHTGIALAGGVVMLVASGAGLGLGAAAGTGDPGIAWTVLQAVLAYAPAVWFTTGLAVAAFGILPRATGLAWALLGYAVLVVYLGGLLQLPDWMLNLSPYTHIPRLPVDEFTAVPLLVLTALAAGLVALGLLGFRRRDLETA
ncbi:MAG TPA: ABC transporter permease [Micromonosporaceae bacterium]